MAEVNPVPLAACNPYKGREIDCRHINAVALRTAAATTSSYVASNYANVSDFDVISLEFVMAWVDSTSTEWYVEWSQDGTTFARSANYAVSGATITAMLNNATIANGASANWIDGPLKVIAPFMRVAVKKTGGVGADTLKVTLIGMTL